VVRALLAAHPYETPVYDVYEMVESVSGFGLGIIGSLAEPLPLSDLLQHVCHTLKTEAVRFAGDPDKPVRNVAVCGGAGRDLIAVARQKGADAYITSDISYHTFFDVMSPDGNIEIALIDAGHYETEVATEQLLFEKLGSMVQDVEWIRTKVKTSPITTYVAS
jgi:putative NIF3 family GTP cyclohydrolase 1 type 2